MNKYKGIIFLKPFLFNSDAIVYTLLRDAIIITESKFLSIDASMIHNSSTSKIASGISL